MSFAEWLAVVWCVVVGGLLCVAVGLLLRCALG